MTKQPYTYYRRAMLYTCILVLLLTTTGQAATLYQSEVLPDKLAALVDLSQGPAIPAQKLSTPLALDPQGADSPTFDEEKQYTLVAYEAYSTGSKTFDIYLSSWAPPYQRLTANQGTYNIEPSLNPGNTRILFVSNRSGNVFNLYSMKVDGTNTTRLTSGGWNDRNPVWSPDGTRIAFSSDRNGNPEIYTINANGTNLLRLTNNSAADIMPTWSPDGTRLAFTSNRTGVLRIYTMNADGTGVAQISTQPISMYPRWSPDGKRIAFSADGNNNGWLDLWVMNSDGTSPRVFKEVTSHSDLTRGRLVPRWKICRIYR